MKRKVAQRRTQCAYAHARSHSGSEECDKVRRTGHTLCSAGVPRVTLPCSLQIAAIARRAQDPACHKKQLNRFSLVQIDSGMVPLPSTIALPYLN